MGVRNQVGRKRLSPPTRSVGGLRGPTATPKGDRSSSAHVTAPGTGQSGGDEHQGDDQQRDDRHHGEVPTGNPRRVGERRDVQQPLVHPQRAADQAEQQAQRERRPAPRPRAGAAGRTARPRSPASTQTAGSCTIGPPSSRGTSPPTSPVFSPCVSPAPGRRRPARRPGRAMEKTRWLPTHRSRPTAVASTGLGPRRLPPRPAAAAWPGSRTRRRSARAGPRSPAR